MKQLHPKLKIKLKPKTNHNQQSTKIKLIFKLNQKMKKRLDDIKSKSVFLISRFSSQCQNTLQKYLIYVD